MRRLVVNADDFGLHPGMNAGVIEAHERGIVTATSMAANGDAFDDAVARLKATPELDVGVHLTLSGEAPLLPAEQLPTLAPGGRLPRHFPVLFRRLFLGQVRKEEIERELAAQMARVRDHGITITHLDGHQHVHLHPAILPIVLDLARRFAVRAVRAAGQLWPPGGIKPAVLGFFSRRAARRAAAAGFRTPDAFVGVGATGRFDERGLLRLIQGLPPGLSELMCHPGRDTAVLAAVYPHWGYEWDVEREALTSPRVREALTRAQVALTSYRSL